MTEKTEGKPELAEGFEYHRFAVVGKVTLSDKKPGYELRDYYSDGAQLGESYYFGMKKYSFTIGGIYEIPTKRTDEGLLIQGNLARFTEMYPDKEVVANWRALARAWDIERELKRREKSAANFNYVAEVLKPLREAYNKTNAIGRLAIEVQMLAALRYDTRMLKRTLADD